MTITRKYVPAQEFNKWVDDFIEATPGMTRSRIAKAIGKDITLLYQINNYTSPNGQNKRYSRVSGSLVKKCEYLFSNSYRWIGNTPEVID